MTLEKAIEKYLKENSALKTLSETTITIRGYELKRFAKFCNAKKTIRPTQIDEDIIIEYMASLNTKPFSKKSILYTLRSFLEYLLKKQIINSNPTSNIDKPKVAYPEADYMTIDEVKKLFNIEKALATPATVYRNLLLLELFFTMCLRASEAVGMKFDDVNLSSKHIWIKRKGGDVVKLPLNQHIADRFDIWFNARKKYNGSDSEFVFLTSRGSQMTTRQARYVVHNAMKRADIKKRKSGTHILRHSGASHRLKKGENIRVIQKLLGHKTLSTTEKYLHFDETEVEGLIYRSETLDIKI